MIISLAVLLTPVGHALAQEKSDMPSTADRPMHDESVAQHDNDAPPSPEFEPAIPEEMTLDQVFDYAESPPPDNYPQPVPDDELFAFTLFEQLEYRIAPDDDTPDHLGWEAQGWIGGDFNKFWWKNEGEAGFDGADEGESETDLLYSRLITPFWNFQVGAQYANEWNPDDYEDRWSGVIALQGLAPYKFELDNSFYISEDGDFTFAFEAEYNIRITQRLVLQPRAELGFAFQDIPERGLGEGVTDANLDLRLRYEINREFAPYIGVRYRTLVGETDNIAEAAGRDSEQLYFLAGLRFAF
jgi:copper resistance protein B